MAQAKTQQNALRNMLLNNGTVKADPQPSAFRHVNKAESQAAAIAARRAEIRNLPSVSRK